jgi:uncharacterized membrane protein YkgB
MMVGIQKVVLGIQKVVLGIQKVVLEIQKMVLGIQSIVSNLRNVVTLSFLYVLQVCWNFFCLNLFYDVLRLLTLLALDPHHSTIATPGFQQN